MNAMPDRRPRGAARVLLLALYGLSVYLLAESFQPPDRQVSARVCVAMIDGYRAWASPLIREAGVRCRYHPSCSGYARDSFTAYGTLEGFVRTCQRLARCAPWGGSGYDPAVAAGVR